MGDYDHVFRQLVVDLTKLVYIYIVSAFFVIYLCPVYIAPSSADLA